MTGERMNLDAFDSETLDLTATNEDCEDDCGDVYKRQVNRQWQGQVYMTAVLHGVLSWGEMEAWAGAPFAFVVPRTTMLRRSLNSSGGGGSAVAVFMNHYRQQGICG